MKEQITIFIVEDDEVLARELKSYLMRWNYDAVVADAFEKIVEQFSACRPHLVLLDVNLPYYDGFYWCRKIREISDVPIMFVSSRSDDADQIMGMAQGGDDYIEKPFHLELLRAKIDAVLRRTYEYRMEH